MQARKRFSVPALLAVVLLPAASLAQTPVKDEVRVDVQETQTGSLMFGVAVNSDAGLTGSVVLNERNFDILRLPFETGDCIWKVNGQGYGIWDSGGMVIYPRDEIKEMMNSRVFRGAGQEFRIEAVPGTQLQRFSAPFRESKALDKPFSLSPDDFFSRTHTE
jgi:outer membrane protein insertion porin family